MRGSRLGDGGNKSVHMEQGCKSGLVKKSETLQ